MYLLIPSAEAVDKPGLQRGRGGASQARDKAFSKRAQPHQDSVSRSGRLGCTSISQIHQHRPPRANRFRRLRTQGGDDMNQGDLAAAVAAATGTGKGEATKMVTVLFELVRDGLKRGEKVAISGFGSFETARREAREGRTPRTGEPVRVAASTTVKFKPGKGLKDALNGGA